MITARVRIVLFSLAAITGFSPPTGNTILDWLSRLISTVALGPVLALRGVSHHPVTPRWLVVPVAVAIL